MAGKPNAKKASKGSTSTKRPNGGTSAVDALLKASPTKKPRVQVDRRSLKERARRAIHDAMPLLPKHILETKRVDKLLWEDRVVVALEGKRPGERLSKSCWQSMSNMYGCEMAALFEYIPRNGEKVSDQLMDALGAATYTDNKERGIDLLINQLQFGGALGEKDTGGGNGGGGGVVGG